MIRGFFSPTHLGKPEPALTEVPLLDAFLYLPLTDSHISLQFLVDTGADVTVLHPQDSLRLLRDDAAWKAVRAAESVELGGAGADQPYYFVPAVIGLTHDDGTIETVSVVIGIGEPNEAIDQHESLLGRDVLDGFRLTFVQPDVLTLDRA